VARDPPGEVILALVAALLVCCCSAVVGTSLACRRPLPRPPRAAGRPGRTSGWTSRRATATWVRVRAVRCGLYDIPAGAHLARLRLRPAAGSPGVTVRVG
jgi:hypothetical protein